MAHKGGLGIGRNTYSNMIFKCFMFVLLINLQLGSSYPFFGGKKYFRTMPIRRSYISVPLSQLHNEYQFPDYEDAFVSPQSDYKFKPYEKYPIMPFLGYYPYRNYYDGMSPRRNLDNYDYFDNQSSEEDISDELGTDDKSDMYPYREALWYDDNTPKFDRNSEANKAFLQNLILAQMYEDSKNQVRYGYDPGSDDYEDQHWFYGVPTTEVDDKEKVKQYFKNKEDENVQELESLARKKEKSKKLKMKDNFRKPTSFNTMEKPTKSKSKMSDDEYFDLQKQLIINGRKKDLGATTIPGLPKNLAKKQIYDSNDSKNNLWNFYKFRKHQADPSTNAMVKLNVINGETGFSDNIFNAEPKSITEFEESPPTKRPGALGQKEVVLPRPSNIVRRPYSDISNRTVRQSSVYDAIKKLLNMEKEQQKDEMSRPQKRLILNEDELTAELSGLKKKSA